MVLSCKSFVVNEDDVWIQPLPVIEEKFNKCLQLHREYREHFHTLKNQLGDKQEFSEVIMFGKFDKFANRLLKISEILTVLQTYRRLRDFKIDG